MIKETYIHRDTSEKIIIDTNKEYIYLGNLEIKFELYKQKLVKKFYDYNKEIFKEFIENIYTKYNFDMINFFLANKISLNEIKIITNIILFPMDFNVLFLSDYGINIVDFFKYIYSRPYELISSNFVHKYFYYLKENKAKINKYNKFPHNLFLSLDLIKNKENFIIKNDNKDIVKDIDDLHINFYGSKCEYYITYEGRKYDLLNDEDRENISNFFMFTDDDIYLSEYYKNDSLYNIIESFRNKEYYTKTIKKDIFYILKNNYKNMNKKEIDKIQKIILKIQFYLYLQDDAIFTNNFKKNLYIINYIHHYTLNKNIKNILKNNYIYKNRIKFFINSFFDYYFSLNETNKIIYKNDIEIIELNIFDFVTLINKNEYLEKDITSFLFNYIYLCTDTKSGDKLFVYKYLKDSEENFIVKFLNREYNSNFLEKVKKIKI